MLVNRPAADIASARKRHFRMLILPKQSSKKVIRRPNLLNIIIFYVNTADILSIYLNRVAVYPVYIGADA